MADQVPYLTCLIHETKKVYKKWLIFVSAIGAAIGLGYLVWAAQDEILSGFARIGSWFAAVLNSINSVISLVPWWLWIIIAVLVAPLVYAAVKCWFIRGNHTLRNVSTGYWIAGFLVGLLSSIIITMVAIAVGSVILGAVAICSFCFTAFCPVYDMWGRYW
jgi:hypothetical protein